MSLPERGGVAALAVLVLLAALWATGAFAQQGTGDQPVKPRPDVDEGRAIFQRDCAVCHGPDGMGTSRGPTLEGSGPAGVHLYVSTGRMPIATPDTEPRRQEPKYTAGEIESLVAYTDGLISGPPAAEVETEELLLSLGAQQFRLNCAACHQFMGVGGVLVGRKHAPTLTHSTPEQVVEAIRSGPGTMPRWSDQEITRREARAIATYVEQTIQHPRDEGGHGLGHLGPAPEGAVAWIFGIGSFLAISRWIGKRT